MKLRGREGFKVLRLALANEGGNTAVYPYKQLREIQIPDDCRAAIADEIQSLETEFGASAVQPLLELLWTANSIPGLFTSHTAVAPAQARPPFEWAKSYVACVVVLLSRSRLKHFDLRAMQCTAEQFAAAFCTESPEQNPTGWHVGVGVCNVIFTPEMELSTFRTPQSGDMTGYGVQLLVGGAAGSRERAAKRWAAALSFVSAAIRRASKFNAMPHRHLLPGVITDLVSDDPASSEHSSSN